jgi:hypothetical protein
MDRLGLIECLTNCAQLMDSKKIQGCTWSDWDQSVRDQISEHLKQLYDLRPETVEDDHG